MKIRAEQEADHGLIDRVHRACFPTDGEARLVTALRAAGRLQVSLVAAEDRGIVGHVAFSPVSLTDTPVGVGLGPLAVLPEFRNRGIGERLVRDGLAACRRARHGLVVVLGDPRYYRRFGFLPAAGRGLRDEYGAEDAFQVLELRPGAIPRNGGLVRYAPEFSAVEPDEAREKPEGG